MLTGYEQIGRESVVTRTFAIIGAFVDDRPLTLGEIVARTGLPKPTVYRLAMSLVTNGFLDHEERGFRLNPRFFALGQHVSPYKRLSRVARPHLERLFAIVHEYVTLQVMTDELTIMRIEYVRDASCNLLLRRSGVAFWPHLHATGSGKALLAFGPQSRLEAYLERPLAARTPHTITDAAEFRRHLKTVRERGYGAAIEESRPGWVTIGAPVLDSNGMGIAAVSVVAETGVNVHVVAGELMKTARLISAKLQRDSAEVGQAPSSIRTLSA